MREILFRAWAQHTIDNQFQYAWDKACEEYKKIEPSKNSEAWDDWHYRRDEYYSNLMILWNKEHDKSERYSKTFEMIDDISVNGKVIHPYGYEIISVMQYVGFTDKHGRKIYEGDIDKFGYVVTYLADLNAGLGMNAGWYLQRDNFESWSELECDEDIEIIGNIFENPELAINNCNTDYFANFT